MKGTIKWYNNEKGYGFIAGEDETDYFVHHTQLPQELESKIDEKAVQFETKQTPRGPQAVSVQFE